MLLLHISTALLFIALGPACNSAEHNASPSKQDSLDQTATSLKEIDPSGLKLADYPSAPHEDRNGNLWFRSVFDGLLRYDGEEFVSFKTKDGLGSDALRGSWEDEDGTLWFATTGGLTKYDGKTFKTITQYKGVEDNGGGFAGKGFHRDLWEVFRDRQGQLWIGTLDGVFQFDGTSFSRFPLPVIAASGASEFAPKMVYCITQDKAGDIWFGTDGAGAIRYDGKNFVVYTAKDNGLCSDRICHILQDSRGNHWFGTSDGGVSRFDGATFTTHLRTKTRSIHMGWGRYMSILEDRTGNIWFGACHEIGGVYRFDGTSFQHFSTKEGLAKGRVTGLSLDRSGSLWLGSTGGVHRYNGNRFEHFTNKGWKDTSKGE